MRIQDNVAGNIDNDGGSDFTVAGHLGVVIFRRNVSMHVASQVGSEGSIVVWTGANKGTYRNHKGLTTSKVILQGHVVVHPKADRDHVAISGVQTVEIHDGFCIAGNRAALGLDAPYGGKIKNGRECFYLPPLVSAYTGFKSSSRMRRGTARLTNKKIDHLGCR